MKHLDDAELSALADGAMDAQPRTAADRHVGECAECRDRLAALVANDRALAAALTREPGDAYFATFADRVAERIRTRGVSMEPVDGQTVRAVPEVAGKPFLALGRWLSGRRLAMVSAAAALVVGVGVVLVTSHEMPVEQLRELPPAAQSSDAGHQATPAAPLAGASGPVARNSAKDEPTRTRSNMNSQGARSPAAMSAKDAQPQGLAKSSAAPAQGFAAEPGAASAPADERTNAPATGRSAPMNQAAPPPNRMRQVRRGDGGEDVPVPNAADALRRQAAPAPAPAPAPSPGALTLRGRRVKEFATATPLAGSLVKSNDAGAPAPQTEARDAGGAVHHTCGVVRDDHGRPVAGAQVTMVDQALTTSTDDGGRWCLDVPAGDRTLSVMAVGFRESRQTLTVTPDARDEVVTLAAISVMGGPAASNGRLSLQGPPGPAGNPPVTGWSSLAMKTATATHPAVHWPLAAQPWVMLAERADTAAARHPSPAAFDHAGEAWGRVAARVKGSPAAARAAVARDAAARTRAWELEPNAARATAAVQALDAQAKLATPVERHAIEARVQTIRAK